MSRIAAELKRLREEVDRYKQWVDDLQSGMYVNCVYCGHRYGPEDKVPSSMADVLKEHVETCPKHPMSLLKAEFEKAKHDLFEIATGDDPCEYCASSECETCRVRTCDDRDEAHWQWHRVAN